MRWRLFVVTVGVALASGLAGLPTAAAGTGPDVSPQCDSPLLNGGCPEASVDLVNCVETIHHGPDEWISITTCLWDCTLLADYGDLEIDGWGEDCHIHDS